ncbi:MAG: protein kinase [Deltaproteobacteria bacterium]|nr:protein kinase [Deltaproteobacteria bacterium]
MQFGRYRLLARIGRGGMAEVYRALAVGPGGFEKEVVVKRILPDLSIDPSFADMFLDEARIASRLDHPNIVQIHDLGCVDETYFIVMEYVRGMDLSGLVGALAPSRTGKPPLEMPVALRIVADVCRALDYAHRTTGPDGKPLGLVHRDVSPQNVLVSDEGAVKLADFGIARAMQGGMGRTMRGLVRGKARYMSPEQARGQTLDARSDVYAAGIVLYELLTYRHPYAVGDFNETLVRASAPAIEPPSSVVPLDHELDALVMHALAPSPDARFSTAAALLEAIETYLHDARLRVGPADIARAVRSARETAPTRSVSLDAVIAGELVAAGATQDLGELEVTGGSGPSGLPMFRRSITDGATLDLPAVALAPPSAAVGLAPTATVPLRPVASPTATVPTPLPAPQPPPPTTGPPLGAAAPSSPLYTSDPAEPPGPASSRALQIAAVLLALAIGSALTMLVLSGNRPTPRADVPDAQSIASRTQPGSVVLAGPIARRDAESDPRSGADPIADPTSTDAAAGSVLAPDPSAAASDADLAEPAASEDREPPAGRTVPPPVLDTRPARLDVGARPNWASIRVNGRVVGTTPCTTSLPPGTYVVTAENPALGLRQRRRVTLRPGGRHRVVFDPF